VVTVGQPSGRAGTLRLTPTEWAILELLVQRPRQIVGSAELLTGVWGPGFQQQKNYRRFHMAHLRRKLEDDPARPRYLLTEPGMGYRYQTQDGPSDACFRGSALCNFSQGASAEARCGCRAGQDRPGRTRPVS
jgi:hypothetical protein